MLKKFTVFFICIFVSFLNGCNATSDSINTSAILANNINYNCIGFNDFGFNINFITSNKNAEIEFIGLNGVNTESLDIKYSDDTIETIKNKKIDGYYVKILGFICHSVNQYTEINNMLFKVDGEEIKIDFKDPIIHELTKEPESLDILSGSQPLVVGTTSVKDVYMTYEYFAEKDAEIIKFGFNDFFIPYNSILLINDELIGTLNDVLPLDVTVGDKITIQTAMDYKDNTLPVNNVYFNSVLEFKPQNISKTYEIKNRLIGQAITNEDDAKLVVSEFKKEMHLE